MSRTARTVAKHRTLWISDVHLGSKGCKARLLTEFLKRNDCDHLYLVGDIFDGWKLKSHFYWEPDHSRVIREVIRKARRGTEVYYLAGNHDDFMRQFVRNMLRFGNIRLANEVVHRTADGRRLLVMHGDAYDDVVHASAVLARGADVAYELLMRGDGVLNRWRQKRGLSELAVSAAVKGKVKAAVQYVSGFDRKVVERCTQDRLDGVVCGHTHHAEIRPLRDGVISHNCGDWVESCSALAEDSDGKLQLLHMDRHALAPRRVVKRRRRLVTPKRREWLKKLPRRVAGAVKGVARRR